MKLKKKHFERLKEMAVKLNHETNYCGLLLSDLITDIKMAQKVKDIGVEAIIETPVPLSSIYAFAAGDIFDKHRQEVEANIQKEHGAMVAASTDNSTTFKGGLRDLVKMEVTNEQEPLIVAIEKDLLVELYDFAVSQAIRNGTMNELLNIDRRINSPSERKTNNTADPKIGDVGYFWDSLGTGVYYGKIGNIYNNRAFKYEPLNYGTYSFKNFSKTPPELR